MNNSHLTMTATNNDIVVYKSKVTYHNTIIIISKNDCYDITSFSYKHNILC